MKFLHEFNEFGNGKKQDNGYWEIRGDMLYNYNGGFHHYTPSPDDEIIECESWDDVMRFMVRDDSEITGWIAPNGDFYGCSCRNHELLARLILNSSERELEERGFCKIFGGWYPVELDYYVRYGHLTEAQEKVLLDKGIPLNARDKYRKEKGVL